MLEESIDHAEDDVRQRQVREARVEADTILHATRIVASLCRGERIAARRRSTGARRGLRCDPDAVDALGARRAVRRGSWTVAEERCDRRLEELR